MKDHSAAEVLRASLVAEGLGTLRSVAPAGDWPIFVNHLPDKPDAAVCVYDTAGRKDGRLHGTGEVIDHPGFQVRVRATGYRTARAKMKAIVTHIDGVRQEGVAIGATGYTIRAITRAGDTLPLGQEPDGTRRESFTVNGTITFAAT